MSSIAVDVRAILRNAVAEVHAWAMDTAVSVAMVTGIAGLLTSFIALYGQNRTATRQGETQLRIQHLAEEFERQTARETRERDAAEQLAQYREPLLDASKDLFHRIRNIRQNAFLNYISGGSTRSRIAMLGTLYRFAKYWGTVEGLYGTVSLLALERNASTAPVAGMLTRLGTAFASDSTRSGGDGLMVWREEQRAIAELMQRGAPAQKAVIGFATFVERYEDEQFRQWFETLETALKSDNIAQHPRLALLQQELEELVEALEVDRLPSQ